MSEVKCKNCGKPEAHHNTFGGCFNPSARFELTPAIEVSGGESLHREAWLDIEIDETLHGNQVRCSAAVYSALQLFMAAKAKGETR